jgi:hypothetical protein
LGHEIRDRRTSRPLIRSSPLQPRHYRKITAPKKPANRNNIKRPTIPTQQNNINRPAVRSIQAKFPNEFKPSKIAIVQPDGLLIYLPVTKINRGVPHYNPTPPNLRKQFAKFRLTAASPAPAAAAERRQ